MKYGSFFYKYLMTPFSMILAGIKWDFLRYVFTGRKHGLTLDDLHKVNELCMTGRFIFLSRRKTHLTTYPISLSYLFLAGRMGYWSHAFISTTKSTNPRTWSALFFEAVGAGVKFSAFADVLNVDGVMVLEPKGVTPEEWCNAVRRVIEKHERAPYDGLFKIGDYTALSCVEVVLATILELPEAKVELFQPFFDIINKHGNLHPQMIAECPQCFERKLEIRR